MPEETLLSLFTVRSKRWIALAVSSAFLFGAASPVRAQVNLPSLGDAVSQDLDVGTERKYGDEVMREIRLDPDYLDDPVLQEYLVGTWVPLVAAARKLGNITDETSDRFAWQTFLVRDKTINAFALPGGFVGVNLGLIAMTGSRDELASVLGHELSHVTQRHIARRIAGDSRNSMLAIGGLILALLAATRGNGDAAQAAIVTSQAAAAAASLAFSRDMEREADRVGFQVMTTAGYSSAGMASMFERMEQATHLMDSGNYPYLRSHPLTTERIGDARSRVGTQDFVRPIGTPEHALMAARARVLMDPRAEAWLALQKLDAGTRDVPIDGKGLDQLGARYASAMASIKLRDWPRAEHAIDATEQQLHSMGDDARAGRVLVYLRAELAEARQQPGAGLAALDLLGPEHSRPMLMQRAELSLQDPNPATARASAEDLQTWVSLNPHDMLAWNTLAQLWDRLGQPLRAVRAQAEARAAAGDLTGAIDRLRSGLRLSRGHDADQIEASVIDARLRTLLYQRRQWLADIYPNGVPRGAEEPWSDDQASRSTKTRSINTSINMPHRL
jgi:predicted Zn-dependent protease